MTFSDENAQLWEGGKGMLILIVWVSKFNESTLYIYIYILLNLSLYIVEVVCLRRYIIFITDFKIKLSSELFLIQTYNDMHVYLLITNEYNS